MAGKICPVGPGYGYLTTLKRRNLALAFAAGNATLWKPSPTTPLCSIAITTIVSKVLERNEIPGAVAALVTGGSDVGEAIVESPEVDLGNCNFFGRMARLPD